MLQGRSSLKKYGIFPKKKSTHTQSPGPAGGLWRYGSIYILSSKT